MQARTRERDAKLARRVLRQLAVALLDAAAIAAALLVALYLRMNGRIPGEMWQGYVGTLPITLAISLAVLAGAGVDRRVWRFASFGDLVLLIEAATVAILVSTLAIILLGRGEWLPASAPIIQWFVLVVLLGSIRIARSRLHLLLAGRREAVAAHGAPTGHGRHALVVGDAAEAELVLRQIEEDQTRRVRAVGIIDSTGADVGLRLRTIRVLGTIDALQSVVDRLAAEGRRPDMLIVATDSPGITPAVLAGLATSAGTLRLQLRHASRASGIVGADRPIDPADLLSRPQQSIDNHAIVRALRGRRVLVTGAGGSIGRELVRQIALADPSALVLVDACELNLYSIDMEMEENFPQIARTVFLSSICQREKLMRIFADHRPEFVFHAAALKHVPLVETDPCAGILTNVAGTRNVCDAARLFSVRAMVQVSTDKAVNPVGMMGATKRLGELYCQALDLASCGEPDAPRFMTVRFGNVLGSSGSLIPLFQRQLSQGGPLTVTHPDMTRFFMTVHEAVQLILQSTARALESEIGRGRIMVLDMGEPVRIIDVARRLIRLAGLEPDRDVHIAVTGLRPGEKLFEELFDNQETPLRSAIPGVLEAEPAPVALSQLRHGFDRLAAAAERGDAHRARLLVHQLIHRRPAKAAAPVAIEPIAPIIAPPPRPAAAPAAMIQRA